MLTKYHPHASKKKSNCEIIQIWLRLRFNVSIPTFGIIHSFVYPILLSIYSLNLVLPNIRITFRQEADA